ILLRQDDFQAFLCQLGFGIPAGGGGIRNSSFIIRDARLINGTLGTSAQTAAANRQPERNRKRVLALTKQNQNRMTEESGIQPSFSEEDMKEYLQQVIEEVKKDRRKP